MKKATYSIKFPKGKTESVQGYVFDIMGLQFGCCKEQCTFNSSYRWRITELSSGYVFLIGDWNKKRKQCYRRTEERIKKVGLSKCKKLIAKVLS